mmetsp:Transcript_11461/g.22764  ORF Transcript_11461/g.22764 Transcript_11461/m.22764 type:complete len:86 (+) Transcript_11461:319-576(+)
MVATTALATAVTERRFEELSMKLLPQELCPHAVATPKYLPNSGRKERVQMSSVVVAAVAAVESEDDGGGGGDDDEGGDDFTDIWV